MSGQTGKSEPESVTETVEAIEEVAQGNEETSVGDVLDQLGARSFGPVLMILGLIEITPIGAIPGIPTAIAVTIALIALQMLFGKDHIWLPDLIENRTVKGKKLDDSAHKLESLAEKMDRWFHGRLEQFTGPTMRKVAAACIIVLCVTVPPLEVIPFASSAPMLAIAAFGLAITARDGLLMVLACALSAVSLGVGTYLYMTSDGSGGSSILPF